MNHTLPRFEVSGKTFGQAVFGGILFLSLIVPLIFSTAFYSYSTPKLVILQVGMVLLAVLWVVGMVLDGEIFLIDTPLYFIFFAFLAVHLISLFQSYNVFRGLDALFQYFCYFLIPVLVFHTVRSKRQLLLLAGVMALTGTIVATIGLLQHNGVYKFSYPWNVPVSTIGNVNFVAEYYNVVFPISLVLILAYRNILLKCAAVLACFLMACHLVVLGSRGGWLGCIVSLSIFGIAAMLRHYRVGRRIVEVVCVPVIVLVMSWPVIGSMMSSIQVGPNQRLESLAGDYWNRIAGRTEDALKLQDDSSRQRVYLWEDTFRMIFDRPVVGVGVGNFEYNIPRYMSRRALEVKMRMEKEVGSPLMPFRAHNEYLEVWAETGILGLGVFFLLLYQVAKTLYKQFKRYVEGDGDLLSVGLAAAFSATLAHSFFSTNLQDPASALHFWIVVGMIWSLKFNAEGEERIGLLVTDAGKVTFGVISAGGIAWIATLVFGVQTLLGDHRYHIGMLYFGQRAYAQAADHLERALRYPYPGSFAVSQALGMAHYNQGQWNEAVRAFRSSLIGHPNATRAHYYLGISLGKLKQHEKAIRHLRRAVELNPLMAGFHLELGSVLGEAGDSEEAIRELETAVRLDPNSPQAHHLLGLARKGAGDLDSAVKAYQKALEFDARDAEVLNSLAVVYVELERFSSAGQIFRSLAEDWPDRPQYRVNLAVVLLNTGQHGAALASCKKALEMDPEYASAYAVMGSVYESQGDLTKARWAYREALGRNPDDQVFRNSLRVLEGAP